MKQIALLENNNIFVTLGDVAKYSGNDIRYIKELIQKYSDKFSMIGLDIGSVNFKGLKPLRLTETQTNFLLMLMRNSENVVKFKLALSVQIETLKNNLYESNTKQLKLAKKQIKEAKRKAYGHTRIGNFQCATNILKEVNADISSEVFNKILLSQGYLSQKEVLTKKYFPNGKESILSDDGNVLIHYDTAISVLEDYDVGFKKDDQMKMEF